MERNGLGYQRIHRKFDLHQVGRNIAGGQSRQQRLIYLQEYIICNGVIRRQCIQLFCRTVSCQIVRNQLSDITQAEPGRSRRVSIGCNIVAQHFTAHFPQNPDKCLLRSGRIHVYGSHRFVKICREHIDHGLCINIHSKR